MNMWTQKHLIAAASSGLCNRLLLLAGSLRIAALTGREFSLYWPVNQILGCPFDHLFTNRFNLITEEHIHPILQTDATVKVYNAWHYEEAIASKMAAHGDPDARIVIVKCWIYPMLETDRLGAEMDQNIRTQLLSLDPVPGIRAVVDAFPMPDSCIGVHVRRGDGMEMFGTSQDEHFMAIMHELTRREPKVNFYFATDVRETEEHFRTMFGDRMVSYPKTWAARGEASGGYEALIELLLLSRTAAVVGTHYSSYSRTAAQIGSQTVVIADASSAGVDLGKTCNLLASRVSRSPR